MKNRMTCAVRGAVGTCSLLAASFGTRLCLASPGGHRPHSKLGLFDRIYAALEAKHLVLLGLFVATLYLLFGWNGVRLFLGLAAGGASDDCSQHDRTHGGTHHHHD